MPKQVYLLQYLPPFMQQYLEMQKIISTEEAELQNAVNEYDKMLNNQFILTADETGVKRFEKFMSIVPSVGDTLEERKTRIISKWNDSLPYTFRKLIEALNVLCGEGNYTIEHDFANYEMHLNVSMSGQNLKQLDKVLFDMIPANIKVTYHNELPRKIDNDLIIANTIVKNVYKVIN